MNPVYTSDELLHYLYNEMDAGSAEELFSRLQTDTYLQQRFSRLKEAVDILKLLVPVSPSVSVIKYIRNYAARVVTGAPRPVLKRKGVRDN